jgi:hypothetical protein
VPRALVDRLLRDETLAEAILDGAAAGDQR